MTNKVRLKSEDEKSYRFALTIARTGRVMSSTTNATRAASFKDEDVVNVESFYQKKNEKLKGTKTPKFLVEIF